MTELTAPGLIWWMTVVEIPALTGLLLLILKQRRDTTDEIESIRESALATEMRLRDLLAATRLEVARGYASQADLKEVESRLVAHLVRIEKKLEQPRAPGHWSRDHSHPPG